LSATDREIIVILVCGEALIDLFTQFDNASEPTLEVRVGGSPLNVATGLARLDTPAAFFGGVSTDHLGTSLANAMRKEGIDTSLIKRSARPTPLVLVAADADGHPSYTFYAHESAVQDVTLADVPVQLPSSVSAIALGSYALAVEPVGTALIALAEREAGRIVISLDCNLRPAIVGPLHVWRQRIERFACCASIIKLSDEDFALGWDEEARFSDRADYWLGHGAKLIVMTRGAAGATAWHRSGCVSLPSPQVEVVDTVGAGDSFQAGLLARLAQNGLLNPLALATLDRASIEDAIRYANIAAGMTCRRRGADTPRRAEVDRAMADIASRPVD
jgi:fructokinase